VIQREGGRIGVIIAKTKREKLLMTCFKEEGRFALLAFSCFEGVFEFMKNQFWDKELRYTAMSGEDLKGLKIMTAKSSI
jgi:hypothetical protein